MKVEIEINTLGEYFYYKRKQKKMTLRDVQKSTGIRNSTLCRIEHNKSVGFLTGVKLLNFYGITLEEVKQFITK